jgi:hypothetical protein
VLCVPLGAALTAAAGDARLRAAILALAAVSVALAALGTLDPFVGPEGIAGGGRAIASLLRRAPVQAAIDLLAFAVTVVAVLRTASRAMRSNSVRADA